MDASPLLFSGSSHPSFAQNIVEETNLPLGKIDLHQFPDGEIAVEILESVHCRDVFIVQTLALRPHFYLMELLLMVDAMRRAGAAKVHLLVPYLCYSRHDRLDATHGAIGAKLVANLLQCSGVHSITSVDLHTGQLQGFFDLPFTHLRAKDTFLRSISLDAQLLQEGVVVSADLGSIRQAHDFAAHLQLPMGIVAKHRLLEGHVATDHVMGDIEGRSVLIVDDICTTGKTLANAAWACKQMGCLQIYACVTHGVFIENAIASIEASPIEKVWVTNSIPQKAMASTGKIASISVEGLFIHELQAKLEGSLQRGWTTE